MLQDQSEIKEDKLNNARSETSRHFRNKRREYMKDKINKLEPKSRNTNKRGLYSGIHILKVWSPNKNSFGTG